ncbi:MAG: AgmX/PglI C-terminal domain-containing protein, partial [Bdellovibrionales bacterium]
AVSHAVAIVLLFATAWVLNKYFNATPEPKLIEVVAQARPKSEIAPVVDVSQHKIVKSAHKIVNKANKTKVVVKNKIFKSNNVNQNRNQKVVARPSKNLNNMGALAMFGGMKTGAVGASGMNLKSHTSSPGIGHNGGEAKSGGYERGLIGSGLVATGIGNSSSKMNGYGGLGTHGRGGGQPGYGDQNIGGGSGGAFYAPLSESDFSDTGLDVDQIKSVIQRNMGQITYCYEQGLQATPGLSGRVQVKFVIAPSGRVSLAKIFDSSVSSRIVENCIVNKLKNWQFPKPVGSVSVRVNCPFLLKRLSQG